MRVYRLQTGAGLLPSVGSVAFHPDGGRIVAQAGHLHVVSLTSGEVRSAPAVEHGQCPTASRDGRFTAATAHWSGGTVVVYLKRPWSREPARGLNLGTANSGLPPWVAFAPDGTLFAALNRTGTSGASFADLYRADPDEALAAFDRPGARTSLPFPPAPLSITHPPILDDALEWLGRIDLPLTHRTLPGFSADGRLLATWPTAGPALVIDATTGQTLHRVAWKGPQTRGRDTYRIALAPDGGRVALIGGGQLICQPPDGSGKPWRTKKPIGYVTDAAFHPDGLTLIAVDRQGRAHRLDAVTGRLMLTLDWAAGSLLCVACSPDGTAAAAGGTGAALIVWDLD